MNAANLAGAFGIALLAGAGTAAAQENINAADQCVWNRFNTLAAKLNALPIVSLKLKSETEQLAEMTRICEAKTNTASEFFKDMTTFSMTIGKVTFEFK